MYFTRRRCITRLFTAGGLLLLIIIFPFPVLAFSKPNVEIFQQKERLAVETLKKEGALIKGLIPEGLRKKFLEAKKKFLQTPAGVQEKKEFSVRGKEFLSTLIETTEKRLENMKSRIEGNEKMPAVRKEAIAADIESQLQYLSMAKTELESSSTPEKVREIAEGIRKEILNARKEKKNIAPAQIKSRGNELLQKFEKTQSRLEGEITTLAQQGYETEKMKELFDSFSSHLAKAQEAHRAIEALVQEEKTDTALSQVSDLSKTVKQELQAAQEMIKQIIAEMKMTIS